MRLTGDHGTGIPITKLAGENDANSVYYDQFEFLPNAPDDAQLLQGTPSLRVFTPKKLTIKNTFRRKFTVTKGWVDVPNDQQSLLQSEVTLYKVTKSGGSISIPAYTTEAQATGMAATLSGQGYTVESAGTCTLNASGNWTHTFTDLDAAADYYAVETAVRKNTAAAQQYVATYSYDQSAGTCTITNFDYIARVSNDGGGTWTYHRCLMTTSGLGEGAFDRANTLTGNVTIETLRETAVFNGTDRYTMGNGFTFTAPAAGQTKHITLKTTQDERWNPGTTKFASVIKRGYNGDSLIKVTGPTLSLEHITLDGNKNTYTANAEGGLVNLSAGTLNIKSGTTLRNSNVDSHHGGAVYATGQSVSVNMEGGLVTGNTSKYQGGGIYVGYQNSNDNCVFRMTGGTISENTVSDNNFCEGGGVYIGAHSTMSMSGGTISGNTSQVRGGGLHIGYSATFEMTGGTISNNTSDSGGGISQWCDVAGTIRGGTISGNYAGSGGGIYIYPSNSFTIAGGTITGNAAAQSGSGVYVGSSGTLNISGGTITGNTVSSSGAGAVEAADAEAKLNFSGAAQVFDNKAGSQQKNVVLNYDRNDIINVTGSLTDAAHIGVYVTGEPAGENQDPTQFDKHGVANAPFGTSSTVKENLNKFSNDRRSLTGIGYDSDNNIYWQDMAAYLKLENRSSILPLYFQITIDDGNYQEYLRKRGSDEQSPVKPKQIGSTGKYCYQFSIGKASVPTGASETLYIPNGSGLRYKVEVFLDANYTQQVNLLGDANITEGEGSQRFDGEAHAFTGTLVTGPRYQVWVGGENGSNPEYVLTPRKLTTTESNFYKNHRNENGSDLKNCYNIATADPGKHVLISVINEGFDVRFQKTDGSGTALAGAAFTLYEDEACTVIKRKGSDAICAESAAAADSSKGIEVGTVLLEKVPSGVWYMMENKTTKTGAEWDSGAPEHYAPNPNKYIVLVGDTALTRPDNPGADTIWGTNGALAQITAEDVTAQTGTGTSAKKFAIFPLEEKTENGTTVLRAVTDPDIAKMGIMNQSDVQPRVILKKVSGSADSNNRSLQGARFRIFRYDLTEVVDTAAGCKMETVGVAPNQKEIPCYESGASGVYFTGHLSVGKYYLLETVAPSLGSSNAGKVFLLTVDENGSTQQELGRTLTDGTLLTQTAGGSTAARQFTGTSEEMVDALKAWVKEHADD